MLGRWPLFFLQNIPHPPFVINIMFKLLPLVFGDLGPGRESTTSRRSMSELYRDYGEYIGVYIGIMEKWGLQGL